MAWTPLLVKSWTRHCKTVISNVTFKHHTRYNYRDQKLHRRDKATVFIQHVKHQEQLTGCVRINVNNGRLKWCLTISLKFKFIKIDFCFGSRSIKNVKIKFKRTKQVTHLTEWWCNEAELLLVASKHPDISTHSKWGAFNLCRNCKDRIINLRRVTQFTIEPRLC